MIIDYYAPSAADESYELIAVRYGTAETTRSRLFYNSADDPGADKTMQIDYFYWLLRNSKRTVVIDTGFNQDSGDKRGKQTLHSVPETLQALGIGPDAPVDVVLTHAHYDHIGNIDYFRKARFHVASAELDFWRTDSSRRTPFLQVAEAAELDALLALEDAGRLTLVEDVADPAPGIRLVRIGGHTPGQLAVVAETTAGTVLLASDVVHFQEELEPQARPFTHFCDLPGLLDGIDEIRGLAEKGLVDLVLTGHDPGTVDLPGARYDHTTGMVAFTADPHSKVHPTINQEVERI